MSRATLTKALSEGKISADKTDSGHWQIEPSELARLYRPRARAADVRRSKPDQVSRDGPDQATSLEAAEMAMRLARTEAELAAERAKVELLERHLSDVRRMLPPPVPERPARRRWWPW